jgi:hypothetical protein
MLRHQFLVALLFTAAASMPAAADFHWTAAHWTAVPSSNVSDSTAHGVVTLGDTGSDVLTANMQAYGGMAAPSSGAEAYLDFTRNFTITGQPMTVQFRRFAIGTVSDPGIPGSHYGAYYLRNNSYFSDSYNPIFPGNSINLDNTQSFLLAVGSYDLTGQFEVAEYRTSGPPVESNINVGFGVVAVPEPQSFLFVVLIVAVLGAFIRSKLVF